MDKRQNYLVCPRQAAIQDIHCIMQRFTQNVLSIKQICGILAHVCAGLTPVSLEVNKLFT